MISRLASVAHRRRSFRRRRDRGERGVVLVYTALMAATIVGFAGFSVDFGRWYIESARVQNATDAAALGGVVQISTDFDDAEDISRGLLEGHGYDDPNQIEVGYGDSVNQMRVTTSSTVDNVFASIFGVDQTTITRSALAEYLGPVPLGSPENSLGNDPDSAVEPPDYWLNIAGPDATKQSGDRFAAKNCGNSVANCDSAENPNNLDYSRDGYFFSVDVDAATGQNLEVQLWDGIMAYVGDYCEAGTLPDAAERADLATWYADADERYTGGTQTNPGPYCTGDQDISGDDVELTVIVREPDDTPWLSTDNPVVTDAGCEPTTLPSYDTRNGPSIYQMLKQDGADYDPAFASMFRRWATVCEIQAENVVSGEYLVQLRSNVADTNLTTFDDQLTYDPSISTGGHNRFSMRVGFDDDGLDNTPVVGNGVQLYANGKFPIYANENGSNTDFYLARVDQRYQGRSLNVTLFDLGDASQAGTLRVQPPEEAKLGGASGSDLDWFSGCNFYKDDPDDGTFNTDPSTCQINDVRFSNGYQGRIVEVVVPIPDDYWCDRDDPDGCWIKVLADFPGGVNDTTTWAAEVIGDPVRLVE
ncbi:MAG: pilus assembly protein TadG-related protein [Acidimicrobiales bacterium]|nr:pilus assembly protein TadG-related protein [Acidimicrobiales bacterium]